MSDYERGVRDGLLKASLIARAKGHTLLACDLEDITRMNKDPALCEHPYWKCRMDGKTFCRSCGTDTTNMEMMGD